MRVTYVVDSDDFGGAEAYVAALLRLTAGDVRASIVATAPMPPRLRAAAEDVGVNVLEVPQIAGKADLRGLWHLGRSIRSTSPDLVHLNMTIPTNNRHAIAVAALLRLPAVATLHLLAPVPSAAHRLVLRALFRTLAGVIAVSEEIRGFSLAVLQVPDRRVRVVPNGVHVPEVVAHEVHSTVRVGSVGRVTSQKGHDVLIAALPAVLATAPTVRLEVQIAGEGPDKVALSEAAGDLPLSFIGFVADVPAFLQKLDVFCLPSRAEGLPFALLEAMAAGLPCVASAVGDIPALLRGVGRLVSPEDSQALADALVELTASADLRRRLGAAARARVVEHYSAEAMASATREVYDLAMR